MGGACSVGGMRRKISSDDDLSVPQHLKSVQTSAILKKSKSDYSDRRRHYRHNNSPLQFDSGELGLSADVVQVPKKGSFVERASFTGIEKAVDMLDALGSGMTNMSNSGFLTGKTVKGNNIRILAFEVANTITRGENLMCSLSKDNVTFIKQELISTYGVQYLVSADTKVLLSLAASDKREELDVFCKEVIRFGNLCKDAQWHNLERFFAKLDSENAVYRPQRELVEFRMQELMGLSKHTAELYHELNMLDRVGHDYRQKVEEMKTLNLPRKGEHIAMLQCELRQQKKTVMSLKKKSLWSKKLEEVVEKLVDIVAFIQQEIYEVFEPGGRTASEETDTSIQRLGPAGLALHYANIINHIDNITSRPTSLPPNIRDTLYRGLPTNVKIALSSNLRKIDPVDEGKIPKIKAEMENILAWLSPMAANTLRAHQGFGWVGEWANASIEFSKAAGTGTLIRLQTLYYADKEKTDSYILNLVTLLHLLISSIRNRDNGLRTLQLKSSRKNILSGTPMKTSPPHYDTSKPLISIELSEEDRRLLQKMSKSRFAPGISKSQELKKNTEMIIKKWKWSRSFKSSLYKKSRKTYPDLVQGNELGVMRSGLEAPF